MRNRCEGVSGHRYPMPHLGRWVNIVGQRWGIGPEGGEAFSSRNICRTIPSVHPSIPPAGEGCIYAQTVECFLKQDISKFKIHREDSRRFFYAEFEFLGLAPPPA